MLVLGGAGFIGAHLAARLRAAGREVVAVDAHRSWGNASPEDVAAAAAWRRRELLAGVEEVALDVRDADALRAEVRARRPAAVVHLANLPLAWVATRRPALAQRDILDPTTSVLDALAGHPARLVYVSSSMAYGPFDRAPMPEDAPLRPVDPYGRAKAAAEDAVRARRPGSVVVRPSAVYGPGDPNGRILRRLVDAGADGTAVEVDDPASALDFTWVGDLADGLARACGVPEAAGLAFNLTRGVARTLAEAAAIAGDVELRVARLAEPRPRRGALDVARARAVLGYAPAVDLEDGLPRLAAWSRAVAA